MPSPSLPQPADGVSLTRQQLDELDALLQRMLALPVHSFEEEAGPADPPVGASVSMLEPEPEPPPLAPMDLAAPSYSFRTDPLTAESPTPAAPEPARYDVEPPPALWLWPVVRSNQLFDHCADYLGRPGRWLRRPAGRTLLGWTGVAFLAAALALLIIDWVRWNW